jgi:hypothetical protein
VPTTKRLLNDGADDCVIVHGGFPAHPTENADGLQDERDPYQSKNENYL